MTRRTVLAGGAVALLAGCGREEETVTAPADALRRQLDAERALAAATARLPRGAPREAAALVDLISTRARARAEEIGRAVEAEGGRPQDDSGQPAEQVAAEEAVARAKAAIVAHVAALPSLHGRALRGLGASMVAGAAGDTALLADALRMPVQDAFPGTPT